jgi:predicted nuclease with TOPRIM domain
MSSSNNTIAIVSLGLGIVVIMGIGGLVAYSNVNNQLVSTQTQLQQAQKERDEFKKQSEEKDKEIKEKDNEMKNLRDTSGARADEIGRKQDEIKRAKGETQIVSGCLKGVLEAISYQDDKSKAIFALGAVKDKCESAGRIVQRIENTQDEQQSPRTSNIQSN